MTNVQRETLDIIREGINSGRPLSFRDIAARRGVAINSVMGAVKALERDGHLVRTPGARGIRLTEPSPLERAVELLRTIQHDVYECGLHGLAAGIGVFLRDYGNVKERT